MRRVALAVSILALLTAGCGGSNNGGGNARSTTSLSMPAALDAPHDAPFAVLSSTAYLDSDSSLVIDGEVQNNSGGAAGEITITVKLFDGRQQPVTAAVSETSGFRRITPAGETTPFSFRFADGKKLLKGIAAYQLAAGGDPTDEQPVPGLAIGNLVTSSPRGGYQLAGELTNKGSGSVNSPEVVATFYNAAGTVVRVRQAVFSEPAFDAGKGDTFTFSFPDGAMLGIARYVLVPQAGR